MPAGREDDGFIAAEKKVLIPQVIAVFLIREEHGEEIMTSVTTAVHIAGKKFIILDYKVPETIGPVEPGCGVICSLRGKSQNGIVLSVHETEEDTLLKELQEVIPGGPIVPEELIQVVFWVADTYMVELSQAISLVFPPFARGDWKEIFHLEGDKEDLAPLLALKPQGKELVDYIVTTRRFRKKTLESKFGKELTDFCLGWLVESGFVVSQREYRHGRKERLQGNMVRLSLENPQAFINSNRRARKQVAVVEFLMDHDGEYLLEDLLERVGTTRNLIKILEDKQVVKVYRAFHPWKEEVRKSITLTQEQQVCLEAVTKQLKAGTHRTFLLHGVTGSGKTEIYVRAAEFAVNQGSKVIVIVPEIALSSQLIRYFQTSFGHRAVVLHSKLASLERYQTWQAILKGEADVVIGTRSAVFAPFEQIGLIIVDEEHDRSLKQDSSPRYHSIGVAGERCRLNGGVLLLGSATPSMESFYKAQNGEIELLEMRHRIGVRPPVIKLVDMREELRQGNTTIISRQVREAIED